MVKEVKVLAAAVAALALGACADSNPTSPRSLASTGAKYVLVGAGDVASVPGPSTAGSPASYPLYAGGGGGGTGTLVGHVLVSSALVSGNTYAISVTYDTDAPYCLLETHLAVELTAAAVPQKNGNPTPGQFDNKSSHTCVSGNNFTYVVNVNLGATDNAVVIAAHAVVTGFNGANFVSGSTMVANLVHRRAGNVGVFSNAAGPLVAAWEPPSGTDPSLWDNQIALDPNGQWLQANHADWVWESNRVLDPIQGTVIEADAVINVPLATTGTFRITCDNGFRVDLNGVTITPADGAVAGFGSELSATFAASIGTNTNLKQANVSGDGWETVGSYAVNLNAGANTFKIFGVNEYMFTDDNHPGFAGVRPADTDPVGTIDNNPAGCIFGLQANGTGSETAWGAPNGFSGATTGAGVTGGNFGGANWATYFVYQVR